MRRPTLEWDADVRLTRGPDTFLVRAAGSHLVLECPSLRASFRAWRSLPARAARRRWAAATHRWLDGAGLSAGVRIGGREIVRLGRDARAGLAARVLGIAP